MGSPLGPTLVNVFYVIIKKFGVKILLLNLNLLSIEGVLMIHSYFFARNITSKSSKLFKSPTQKHEIHLKMKNKNENSTWFLDINITRDNNKFMILVYRKPTFSGIFTNFGSFIPKSYKHNLLFTLLHRAFKLCSTLNVLIRKLTSFIFENNGYPKCFFDSCIKKNLDKVFIRRKVVMKGSKNSLFVCFHFLEKSQCN